MPYAIKKPHPTHANVKVWHTWDPDGDGYEEVRKFPTSALAEQWVSNYHPDKSCEVVEIGYEIGQDDEIIQNKYNLSMNPETPDGLRNLTNRDDESIKGPLTSFTINGELD